MATRREDNTAATRQALLVAGRELFAESGFDATGIEAIAERARVTTGALYHHFANKKAVFQAVAEQIEAELLALGAQAGGTELWDRLDGALVLLIEPCAAPDVQRIVFHDGPRVLAGPIWDDIEQRYALGALSSMLERLQQDRIVVDYPAQRLAAILLAGLSEVAAAVAGTPKSGRAKAVDQAVGVMRRLLAGMRLA